MVEEEESFHGESEKSWRIVQVGGNIKFVKVEDVYNTSKTYAI